ncbi:hypothetical protein ACIRD8_17595 [Streptomyces sp. NPDC102451]|uniref:hypothetical protein n=1 Tax=Streptomyces sp. NPDC102451 TaxID=3366177 RepID=UPI00380839B2
MTNKPPQPREGEERDPAGMRRPVRPDIEFRPVRNGMDFLLSAVEHLTFEALPSDRDLKYAVLHLHAAVEVLLKARLVREHWSLVFKDPAKATAKDFADGSFSSTTIEGAMTRLREIAGVNIDEASRSAIIKLTQTRNAFTHYGHSASAYAVEAQATRVLSFLVDFIAQELYDRNSSSQFGGEYDRTMRLIQTQLGRIDTLVKNRMRKVDAELADQQERTVLCPACRQPAVVVGRHPHCRFCYAEWPSAHELAGAYISTVLKDHDGLFWYRCDDCAEDGHDEALLVLGASTADALEIEIGLCFRCGARYRKGTTSHPKPQPHMDGYQHVYSITIEDASTNPNSLS